MISDTATYSSWEAMKSRCFNRNHKGYRAYGGMGITVCERWLVFANFLADMGERPAGMTLDRKDSGGNYEPDNCRWATRLEQSRNRGCVKLNEAKAGEIRRLVEAGAAKRAVARSFGVSQRAVHFVVSGRIWGPPRESPT